MQQEAVTGVLQPAIRKDQRLGDDAGGGGFDPEEVRANINVAGTDARRLSSCACAITILPALAGDASTMAIRLVAWRSS
jgi:hypothetical protein